MSRTMQRLALSGTILLAVAALSACADDAGAAPTASMSPAGTWGDPAASGEPSLVLADDGALTGTDGCNRLVGTWTADGDTLAFVDIASTRMMCAGVDTWLATLASGTMVDDTLTVFDDAGDRIGTLDRSE